MIDRGAGGLPAAGMFEGSGGTSGSRRARGSGGCCPSRASGDEGTLHTQMLKGSLSRTVIRRLEHAMCLTSRSDGRFLGIGIRRNASESVSTRRNEACRPANSYIAAGQRDVDLPFLTR